jgi:hypothetical protein
MEIGFFKKVEIDLSTEVIDQNLFVYKGRNVKSKEKIPTYVISKKREDSKIVTVNSKPIKTEGKEIYLANN